MSFVIQFMFLCFFILFPIRVLANCNLDYYFSLSDMAKEYEIKKNANDIDLLENSLTLLPNVTIGVGQQKNDEYSFKSIEQSSLSIGISQSIYSGGVYNKTKKKLAKLKEIDSLNISLDRNRFFLSLLKDVSEYNYLLDQLKIFNEQLEKQKDMMSKSDIMLRTGKVSHLEFSINEIKVREAEEKISKVNDDMVILQQRILSKYKIPESQIKRINVSNIMDCKNDSERSIIHSRYEVESEIADIDSDIDKASLKPSVSMSLMATPWPSGTIQNINKGKFDYNVSVGINIPVTNLLLSPLKDRKKTLLISSLKIKRDSDIINNEQLIRELKIMISGIIREITFLKDDIAVKKRKLDYIQLMYNQKKESIITFYEQLEQFQFSELNLKRKERELEYYKVYLDYVS